jgi:hypothetical protein
MKYYKIVNPTGNRGIVYHEGINENPFSSNPSEEWGTGGISFAREDILGFIGYGTDVYEVKPLSKVYEISTELIYPREYKAEKVRLNYVGKVNDIKVIKMLVREGANIRDRGDYALRWATENMYKYIEIAKFLAKKGDYPKETKKAYAKIKI